MRTADIAPISTLTPTWRVFSPLLPWQEVAIDVEVAISSGGGSGGSTASPTIAAVDQIGVVVHQAASFVALADIVFGENASDVLAMRSCQFRNLESAADSREEGQRRLRVWNREGQNSCLIAGQKLLCSPVVPEEEEEDEEEEKRAGGGIVLLVRCRITVPALPPPSISVVRLPGRHCFESSTCYDQVPFRVTWTQVGGGSSWSLLPSSSHIHVFLHAVTTFLVGAVIFSFRRALCNSEYFQYAVAFSFLGCVRGLEDFAAASRMHVSL